MDTYDELLKFQVIGDSGVGKSSLLLRFTDDMFQDSFISTIGVDFKIRNVTVGDKLCKLQIWDTAGQNRFRTFVNHHYRGAHGIILVFDITDQVSFKNAKMWLSEIERFCGSRAPKVLVGNKTDLGAKRAINTKDAQAFADQYGFDYFETSAKTGENVEDVFMHLAQEVMKRRSADKLKAQQPLKSTTDSSDEESAKKTKSWKWFKGGKEKSVQPQSVQVLVPVQLTLAQKIRQSDGYRYLRARAGMRPLSGKSPAKSSPTVGKQEANRKFIQSIEAVLNSKGSEKGKISSLRDIVSADNRNITHNTSTGLYTKFHRGSESTSDRYLQELQTVVKHLCNINNIDYDVSSSYQSAS